jgi:hypothetical protein
MDEVILMQKSFLVRRTLMSVVLFAFIYSPSAFGQSPSVLKANHAVGFSGSAPAHPRTSPPLARLPLAGSDSIDSDPGPFVIVGALLGGLGLGGAAALSAAHCNDCNGVGAGIYIAGAIGAVIGGFAGWLVYKARR